ncbi:hypothetical protein NKG94_09965 [Micromonospora sp. M12]
MLTGAPPHPDVWIRVDLTADAPAAGVREHVRAAVRRFAATTDCQPAHLDVTARIEPGRPERRDRPDRHDRCRTSGERGTRCEWCRWCRP